MAGNVNVGRAGLCVFLFLIAFSAEGQEAGREPDSGTEDRVYVFFEQDVGVLLMFQGLSEGLGIGWGPFRGSVAYSSFKSRVPSLGGFPDGFSLEVRHLLALNLDYFFNGVRPAGFYGRLAAQWKQQLVTEEGSGAQVELPSFLVGSEIGYAWRLNEVISVAPKLGLLYYVVKPQGADNDPVLVGSAYYDNPKHKTSDFYYSISVAFRL